MVGLTIRPNSKGTWAVYLVQGEERFAITEFDTRKRQQTYAVRMAEFMGTTFVHLPGDGRGGYVPRFGYRRERLRNVPDEGEQQALSLIMAMHDEGASLRQIAEALTEAGHTPRRGKKWHPQTLKLIIERETEHAG